MKEERLNRVLLKMTSITSRVIEAHCVGILSKINSKVCVSPCASVAKKKSVLKSMIWGIKPWDTIKI